MPEIIVKLGDRVVQKYFLYKNNRMSIGRAPDNDIAIENPAVSRRHASIQLVNGRYILEDNQSANGTYVNGVRISKTEILDKDVITIGKHKLHFYNQDMQQAQVAPVVDEKTYVVNSQPVAQLRVVSGGKQSNEVYQLAKADTRVGRAADNDIRLNDWFVSKHHAVIGRKGLAYVIKDLDSWRHTMVNGEVIEEATLKAGDEVQFGPKITMRFELIEAEAGAEGEGRRPVELGDAPAEEAAEQPAEAGAEEPAYAEQRPGGTAEELPEPEPELEPVAAEAEEESDMSAAIAETVSARREDLERQYAEAPSAEAEPAEAESAPEMAAVEAVASPAEGEHDSGERRKKKKKKRHDRGDHAEDRAAAPAAPPPPPDSPMDAPPAPPTDAPMEAPVQAEPAAAAAKAPEREYSDAEKAEIEMWEKGLANPSPIIRKQAARKLKKITGRDYNVD